MPVLTPTTRRKLKYLPQAGQALHGAGALACWNWALTGLGPTQNNPDQLFNFVSFGIPYVAGNVAWYNVVANQNRLQALQQRWAPHANAIVTSPALRRDLHAINVELTKLSISLNGMVWTGAPTPYQVVMHYDPQNANGTLNGPNYTHWWLQVDGGGAHNHNDGLEVFPGNPNLNIRRPEYDSGPNNCRVYVQQLHQDHVNRINNVLDLVITANHLAVPHNAWTDSFLCAICNSFLAPGITRHHCRCCGRSVCAACSPNTRVILRNARVPVAQPGVLAGLGPYRVCLFC